MIKTLALLCLLVSPALAQEPPRASLHFSPRENLEKIDVELLGRARKNIDIAAYVLTDVPVIDALIEAAGRGVTVRLYRDAAQRNPGARVNAALALLEAAPIEQRRKRPGPFMHLKGYAVDGLFVRLGAANFSASGLKHQDNDLIILTDPEEVKLFQSAFEAMWGR